MKKEVLRNSAALRLFMRAMETTVYMDRHGKVLGMWVPTGQEPPEAPPEPPEATAAVGAKVPKGPRHGGPGAAVYRSNPMAEEEFGILPAMSVAYRSGQKDYD